LEQNCIIFSCYLYEIVSPQFDAQVELDWYEPILTLLLLLPTFFVAKWAGFGDFQEKEKITQVCQIIFQEFKAEISDKPFKSKDEQIKSLSESTFIRDLIDQGIEN